MPEGPTKAALRVAALARRDDMSAPARASASREIAARVAPILSAARPKIVAAYVAFGSEADPSQIVVAANVGGMATALPAMIDGIRVAFRRYRPGDALVPDAVNIPAPLADSPQVDPDLFVMPVTAFDRSGARLGKGRGVYDRAVADFRARGLHPALVGIAFSVQEVPAIAVEPHDVRLDWIVTERETIRCPASPR